MGVTIEEFWTSFVSSFPAYSKQAPAKAWQFGVDPDHLADLVKAGIKTATASGYRLYDLEEVSLPSLGELNIILNSQNQPICLTRT